MKPRIALVRGHHLSKEETLSYEPLLKEFDFVCFSSDNPWFDHSEISFPIRRLRSPEGMFRFMPRAIRNGLFGLMDNVTGAGQWMFGLESALKGFDLVHVSDSSYFFVYQAAMAKKKLGFKLIAIQYENIPFARDHKPVARYLKSQIYPRVDAFMAMSERAKAALELEGVNSEKIYVVGNAVDVQKFRPMPQERLQWRQRFGFSEDDIVILFVGRIRASKGIFELIYATKRLVMDPAIDANRLKVVIAGRGPREKELFQRIRQLKLEGVVRFIGYVPHKEIHLLHNMTDIFTLPSIPRKYWQEQFGIVLIESMACAKPVVTTFSGSIPEVVGDGALLVQPNDHLSLYYGLRELILNESKRSELASRARSRALIHFDQNVIGRKIQAVFENVLKTREPR